MELSYSFHLGSDKNKKATKKQDRFPASNIQHSRGFVNTFLYKTYFYALGNLQSVLAVQHGVAGPKRG